MAKKPTALNPDDTLHAWLDVIVRTKVDILLSHIRGSSGPIEGDRLHKMRVSARRLEAVLRIFKNCFPKNELKSCDKLLRDLRKSLGGIREIDVFLLMMNEQAGALPGPNNIVIDLLLARKFQERIRASRHLEKVLKPFRKEKIRRSFLELTRKSGKTA